MGVLGKNNKAEGRIREGRGMREEAKSHKGLRRVRGREGRGRTFWQGNIVEGRKRERKEE